MEWISLKDKYPNPFVTVILTDGKKVFPGWLESYLPLEDPLFCDSETKDWPENITHWMPLPAPPND